jgi:hypothetical protein
MLLPNPIFLAIVAGDLLVILFNVLHHRRVKAKIEGSAKAFSPENPSPHHRVVLSRGAGDTYAGAFIGAMFMLCAGVIFLPTGLSVWDPGYTAFWSDPGFLSDLTLQLAIFVLAPLLICLMYSGEFFLLSEEGLERIKGGKRTMLFWKSVTSVSLLYDRTLPYVRLATSTGYIDVVRNIKGAERIYEAAVRNLPEDLRGSEAYQFMANGARTVPEVRKIGSADTRRASRWRVIGLVIAFGGIWIPLLFVPQLGSGLAGLLVLVILFGGLFLGIIGSTKGSSFDIVKEVRGISPEQAERTAEDWLRGQGAEDVERTPGRVRAVHGSKKVKVWSPGARKVVDLTFTRAAGGTRIDAVLRPGSSLYADDVVQNRDRTMVAWGGWLEGLWKALEVNGRPDDGTGPQPAEGASTG